MNKIKNILTAVKNTLASFFVFCFLSVVGLAVVSVLAVVGAVVVPLGALSEAVAFYRDVNKGNV